MEKTGKHEVVVPSKGLPFKMFYFEGSNGKYIREKHWHRSVELFAVAQGNLSFYLNDKKYPLKAGEFLIVNSNEVHAIHAATPNRTYVVQVPLALFEAYYTGDQFIWFSHQEKIHDKKVFQLVQEMFLLQEEGKLGWELKAKSLFYELLYLFVTQYRKEEPQEELEKSSRQLRQLGQITGYIKEHYWEDISLVYLAQKFGYSPAYLSRMFLKYAKINYKDYLHSVRLEYAKKDLEKTDKPIGELALDNGFPSSKAFSSLFKRQYGMLPNEYRKMNMEHVKKETFQ